MNYLKNFMTTTVKKLSKKLITHNGAFHADDIFATAALEMMLEAEGESYELIRTRDEAVLKTGDYVYDVGGIYDEDKNRFDHHQVGGAGRGPENIEYSSLGLVWKKFGEKLAGSKRAADIIEKNLCAPIDAWDNGFDLVENKHEITPFYLQNVFSTMMPTWKEMDINIDEVFLKCVEIAKIILERTIKQAQDILEGEEAVISIYNNSDDKKIIILDKNYPFEYILANLPEPLFVVYPRKANNDWGVRTVRSDMKSFVNRKNLPKIWAGLKDDELQNVTGVRDAVFCHRTLFVAVAKSKVGAVKLAQIAVES